MSGSETVDLVVIARLERGAAWADLYCCDLWYDTANGALTGRACSGWWGAEVCEPSTNPDKPATIADLDEALAALGYHRSTPWRERVTAAGVVRYFADARIRCEDIA